MDNKNLQELSEAYSSIYSENEFKTWVNSLVEEGYDLSEYTWEEMYDTYINEASDPRRDVGARMGRAITSTLRDVGTGALKDIRNLTTTGRLADTPERQRIRQGFSNFTNSAQNAINRLGGYPARQTASTPASRAPARPAATNPASRPAGGTQGAATNPASRPAGGSQGAAARPATPGSGAKVNPSSTPTPAAGQTGDKAKDMETWAKANPKLAAAQAERDRTRGTSATTNPLMKDFKDKLPAPKTPSPTTTSTAFAKPTPTLSSPSSSAVQSGGSAAASRPSTNQVTTAFSNPALSKRRPVMSSYEWGTKTIKDMADAYSSIYEAKKKVDQDQDGDNDFADVRIARLIASGVPKEVAIAKVRNKSYNEEVEQIDEIAPLVAGGLALGGAALGAAAINRARQAAKSGVNAAKSGAKVKPNQTGIAGAAYGMQKRNQELQKLMNQSYQPEGEMVDEATRMRKELGKEGETATRKELAARSKAFKRSDSVDKTIAAAERGADRPYIKHKRNESDADRSKREEKQSKTLRNLASSRRKSVRGEGGLRGYAAKVEGSDKDLQSARSSARSAGTLTPKEKKEMGEDYSIYEIVASYLLENNFAKTQNDANVIIENMSEVWLNEILESI